MNANAFEVRSPFDGAHLCTLEHTPEAAAFAALERASALYADRAGWLPAVTRIGVLERLASLIEGQIDALAHQAAAEGGKPLRDSIVEINRAVNGVRVAVAEIAQLKGTEIRMGLTASSVQRFAHTYLEPCGVVLAISAFNHPFNLIIHQVITAIAAGCPVLIKPALTTPMSCISVVELLAEAGLPEGWCQLLLCEDEITGKLVADTRVAFMTFIGSARVGWHLRSKLAPGARCVLEHGGLAPVIVDDTADIEGSIAPLVRAAFYHAGQVCVSAQRVYVHRSVIDRFATQFVEATKALVTGDPLNHQTDVGPLIRPREVQRVHGWVEEALEAGAKLLCGGRTLSPTTYAPTVLLDPPDEVRVSQKEIFGPVVSLYAYDSIDDAIARANGPDVFFQASIFTRDLDTALSASRRLNGMAVMVNEHPAFRVDWMPFGAGRQSGLGLGGIGNAMRDMSTERMVVFRSAGI